MNFFNTLVSIPTWGILTTIAVFTLIIVIAIIVAERAKKRLIEVEPYEIGSLYTKDTKKQITVEFSVQLYMLSEKNTYVLFDILDRFWENPAKKLNSFYDSKNCFGIQLEVVDVIKTQKNKFRLVVTDRFGNEYVLLSKRVPEEYLVEIERQ